MSLTAKTIQKLVDAHTADIVQQLAAKYGFDAAEAQASLVHPTTKSKSPRKPRAKNAYMRFSSDERPKLKEEHPDMAPKDVLKELGKRWSALTDEQKDPYVEAYNEEKAELDEKAALEEQAASD